MRYKIEKGDRFLCIKDYIMDDGRIAYYEGNIYYSELKNCITDNQKDVEHRMYDQDDFFDHFKFLSK